MLVYLAMIDSPQDKDKFAQIYAEYRDMMLRIARRFFSNEADAEDAVHQAFLKIIDRMDKNVQIDCHKTKSYIAIVTEHTSIDHTALIEGLGFASSDYIRIVLLLLLMAACCTAAVWICTKKFNARNLLND